MPAPRRKTPHYLGLDLGGTQIKAVVVDAAGRLVAQTKATTPRGRQVDSIVAQLVSLSRKLSEAHPEVCAIGVGAPGLIDAAKRVVRVAPNFPDWDQVPLRDLIAAQVALPVFLENDVNCFALAEQRWGAGRGFQHFVALAVGTGIGGALILNGKLYRGSSGAAGELGHVSVDLWGPRCACGNYGCAERYLGELWFTQAAQEALDDPTIATPQEVSHRATGGDQRAAQFIAGRGEILGVACTSLIHSFDPEAIIIGGGIAQAGEIFFAGVRRAINERAYKILADKIQILPAQLGTQAGALGAAALGIVAEEEL